MIKDFYVHESSFIGKNVSIKSNTKIWHFSNIMENVSIGSNCIIGQNSFIGKGVNIGNNVKIQNNVSIYEGVECHNNVFIGPSVVFTNVINPRSEINKKKEFKKTIIKNGSSIGANATIICGVVLGAYSFIGAGTVVTKDIKNFSLVVGNPGVHINWVSKHGNKLIFNSENLAICELSKQRYQLSNNFVEMIDE